MNNHNQFKNDHDEKIYNNYNDKNNHNPCHSQHFPYDPNNHQIFANNNTNVNNDDNYQHEQKLNCFQQNNNNNGKNTYSYFNYNYSSQSQNMQYINNDRYINNDINHSNNFKNNYGNKYTIIKNRYILIKRLQDALQGDIFLANDIKNNNNLVVIKKIYKTCVYNNRSIKGTVVVENILNEKNIMLLLGQRTNSLVNGFIRALEFFEDNSSYYLVQEYGGKEFLSYALENFFKINNGEKHWQTKNYNTKLYAQWKIAVCQYMHSILRSVCIMHDVGKIAHCDLSLENVVINEKNNELKIIDFGCAFEGKKLSSDHEGQIANNDDLYSFIDSRFKGKSEYVAPEVYQKKEHDCRKADVYSIGIIFFVVLFGTFIYKYPHDNDENFKRFKSGNLLNLLRKHPKAEQLTTEEYDLLHSMLEIDPNNRPFAKQLLNHNYFRIPIEQQLNLYEYLKTHQNCLHPISIGNNNANDTLNSHGVSDHPKNSNSNLNLDSIENKQINSNNNINVE